MIGKVVDELIPDLILLILLVKNRPKVFARTTGFVWSGKTILGGLCNIFLKQVHSDFGFPSFSYTIFENWLLFTFSRRELYRLIADRYLPRFAAELSRASSSTVLQ